MALAHDARRNGNNRFYPRVPKRELFARGYIALHSRHSNGIAVDPTLTPPKRPPYDPQHVYGACTASHAQTRIGRQPRPQELYGKPAVRPAQHRRHVLLVTVMRHCDFKNNFRQWWHFEYDGSRPRWE